MLDHLATLAPLFPEEPEVQLVIEEADEKALLDEHDRELDLINDIMGTHHLTVALARLSAHHSAYHWPHLWRDKLQEYLRHGNQHVHPESWGWLMDLEQSFVSP